MPKVGDGTGTKGGQEGTEGLTWVTNKKPESAGGSPYGQGSGGKGPEMESGGNRMSPLKGGKGGSD